MPSFYFLAFAIRRRDLFDALLRCFCTINDFKTLSSYTVLPVTFLRGNTLKEETFSDFWEMGTALLIANLPLYVITILFWMDGIMLEGRVSPLVNYLHPWKYIILEYKLLLFAAFLESESTSV